MGLGIVIVAIVLPACQPIVGPGDNGNAPPPQEAWIPNIQLNCVPHGGGSFGKHCTGFVDISIRPALPSNHRLGAVLNGMSITGEARTNGGITTRIPLEGDAIGCPFSQPSFVAVHDDAHFYPSTLALVEFRWTTGTLCTQW